MSRPRVLPPRGFLLALVGMGLVKLIDATQLLPGPWRWLGAVPLVLGLALAVQGSRQFAAADTNIVPFTKASSLVTGGVFALSRNPMYLGMILALAGVALLLNALAPWLVVAAFGLWLELRFVRREERFMEETFGPAYLDYQRRVRRWL